MGRAVLNRRHPLLQRALAWCGLATATVALAAMLAATLAAYVTPDAVLRLLNATWFCA